MTEFETMVREMREAQKAWFRYHDQLDLQKAKALEKKVDAALERKAALDQVPDLFADSNGEYGGRGNRSGGANTANLDGQDGQDGRAGTGGLGWVPGGGAE